MIEKVVGIVTDVVKYSDRQNIVTVFAREQGRVPFLVSAGAGRGAAARNARLMPLSVISADVNFNPTRELQFLSRFTRERLWRDIYFNPVKSAIGLFIAEFVSSYVRQSPPDPPLWDYIVATVRALDDAPGQPANLHLAFLIGFMTFAGIRPDLAAGGAGDLWFDMRGGVLTPLPPGHRDVLSPVEARMLPLLSRLNLRTAALFRFSAAQRRELLAALMRYYAVHFPGLGSLKSPAVLAEVFNT